MKKKKQKKNEAAAPVIYGDPVYGADEDIYANDKRIELKEGDADSEDLFVQKINPGAGLDIPGTEMDDRDEGVGSEDEENNYYSIGGDNHNNLKEYNEDDIGEDED